MDANLEAIIGNFMSEIEGYEQRTGCFVELFRAAGCRDGKLKVEVEKCFGHEANHD